jgi:aspartate ammonia-lyase
MASSKTRIEHDLLGDLAVPADAYYGVQTARALENFQISGVPISLYPNFIKALAMVKLAAARATPMSALCPRDPHRDRRRVPGDHDGKLHDQFSLDVFQGGAGTSTNMARTR